MNKHQASSSQTQALSGEITLPGDKSVSHRAIMLSAIAQGESRITGLLESEDVKATIAAFSAMGVNITAQQGAYIVQGVGLKGLKAPKNILDMGNSGTSMRLIAGLLAGQDFEASLTGDASLQKRPMERIITPLRQQGAVITAKDDNYPPLRIKGNGQSHGGEFSPAIASAQVKSAILLAGLYAKVPTIIHEHTPTRDYTEKMLQNLGADIQIQPDGLGGNIITLNPTPILKAKDIAIAGDISSAAFPMVAAAIVPGSDVILKNIGLHATRNGIIYSLQKMGADITISNLKDTSFGQMGDIRIKYRPLQAAVIKAEAAASQIDEYPILAIAAACSNGETIMEGLKELRVKESDRLSGIVQGLRANHVEVEEGDDWIKIYGQGKAIFGGGFVKTHLDHRMAMAFLIAGAYAENPITVDDASPIETSFPGFMDLMNGLGTNIKTI